MAHAANKIPDTLSASGNPTKAYRRELLQNQIWQVLNFGSKAGFLLLLTPLMISKWGGRSDRRAP